MVQLPIPTRRVWIDANDGLAVQILQGICDETVLPQRDDSIVRREDEVWKKAAIDGLHAAQASEQLLRFNKRAVIRFVLAQVIREICPLVLDVEARLADGIEPNHQFSQARRARDEDDFVVGQAVHLRAGCGTNNSRKRSGEVLIWPILSALPASSFNAKAINCSGFMPVLARTLRIFASAALSAFMVLDTP